MRNFHIKAQDSSNAWDFRHPISLVWTDPPFGTNKIQASGVNRYKDLTPKETTSLTISAISNLYPYLTLDGVVCVCADYRTIHKIIVGLEDFLVFQGEIIWTFGLGRPRSTWWPVRHNTIATFTVTDKLPVFDASAIPREIRKAPKPGYAADKPAGSVWDKTMSNTDPERVGYPNQKPLDIINPFILAHTKEGDTVADPFLGSGSTGIAAIMNGRHFIGQDSNPQARDTAHMRLSKLA